MKKFIITGEFEYEIKDQTESEAIERVEYYLSYFKDAQSIIAFKYLIKEVKELSPDAFNVSHLIKRVEKELEVYDGK